MHILCETFRQIGNLTGEAEAALFSTIERKEYPPKTILQDQDKISNTIYFIEKGIARTFYYKDGKDITHWIAVERDFVGSMSSFFLRKPGNKMVETLEYCVLWEFENSKLESLFESNAELAKIGRLFAYYGLSLMEERFDNLHFNSAKERLEILQSKQPELFQRVPLGIIASYLGMSQETLSRIRK